MMADLGSTRVYGDLDVKKDILVRGNFSSDLDLVTEREDVSVTKGQTSITLSSISLKSSPVIFVDGYMGKEQIIDFSITSSNAITLTNSIENDGTLTVIQYTSTQ